MVLHSAARLFSIDVNSPFTITRAGFFLSWILLGAGLFTEILFPGFSERFRSLPFLLSIVLFGLPHGAADLMLLQTHSKAAGLAALLWRFGTYLGLMFCVVACLLAFPKAVLALFLLLSAWHFGTSDVHDLQLLGHHEHSRWRARMRSVSRGALLLGLPLAASPAASLQVAADWMVILRPQSSGVPLTPEQLAIPAGWATVTALVIGIVLLVDRLRRGRWGLGLTEAVETLLLVAVLARLDPLFGVGLYFLACHSLRHVVKLMGIWSPADTENAWWEALKMVYLKSLPLLVPTLLVLAALGAWAVQWEPDKLVTLLLMVFAVVTLSHHLLVDRILGLEDVSEEVP